MRVGFIAGLLLAASLAGCLNGDEPTSTTNDSGDAGAWDPDLADVTMEGAAKSRPNETTIVFLWNDTTPARATFTVPATTPFAVEGAVEWDAEATLALTLGAPNVTYLCTEQSASAASCGVRSLPQAPGTQWEVAIDQAEPVENPIDFQLALEIRAIDPAKAPSAPSLIPEISPRADPVDPGWPTLEDATIRPGVQIDTCTANFIFTTRDNTTLYIGTAAHCVGERSLGDPYLIHSNPVNDQGLVKSEPIEGTIAYCSWGAIHNLLSCPHIGSGGNLPGRGHDFALIEIPEDDRDKVHPAMRVWGGPTRVGDPPTLGTEVRTYGNTLLRDGGQDLNVLDSRPGVVVESNEVETRVYFAGPALFGDSGSPVTTASGATVGAAVELQPFPPLLGSNGVSNLAHGLAKLEELTNRTIELKTWPIFDLPRVEPLPGGDDFLRLP